VVCSTTYDCPLCCRHKNN